MPSYMMIDFYTTRTYVHDCKAVAELAVVFLARQCYDRQRVAHRHHSSMRNSKRGHSSYGGER